MSVTEIENYRELILENIEYDCLKQRYPLYLDDLNEIVELLVETVCNELKEWCKENNTDLYGDGLKIYTTLDSRMQQYAEEAVSRQMREVQKRFDAHWGTQAPWRDRNGEEIPRFIEELAEKTPSYQYLSHKYGNQTDSITYYLNQPHRCKVFDYDLGQKDTLLSTMDSIRYMERFMHCGFVAIAPHTGEVRHG